MSRYPGEPGRRVVGLHYVWDVKCEGCFGSGTTYEVTPGTENDWIPDGYEVYCGCEAGRWRRIYDGAEPAPPATIEAP